jgi:hypothetical protein
MHYTITLTVGSYATQGVQLELHRAYVMTLGYGPTHYIFWQQGF